MLSSHRRWPALVALVYTACGSNGNEADQLGVGAQCMDAMECSSASVAGSDIPLECLAAFKGGYCGLAGCSSSDECPSGSACAQHDDGNLYCFRTCVDKVECNRNRDTENEANCSGNVSAIEESNTTKLCVPPSAG